MNCTKAGRYSRAVRKEHPRKVIDLNEPMIREDQCWNSKKIRACVPRNESNAEFAALDHESSFLLLLVARNLIHQILRPRVSMPEETRLQPSMTFHLLDNRNRTQKWDESRGAKPNSSNPSAA